MAQFLDTWVTVELHRSSQCLTWSKDALWSCSLHVCYNTDMFCNRQAGLLPKDWTWKKLLRVVQAVCPPPIPYSQQHQPLTVSSPREWASSAVCSRSTSSPSARYRHCCRPFSLLKRQRVKSVAGSVLYGPPLLRKYLTGVKSKQRDTRWSLHPSMQMKNIQALGSKQCVKLIVRIPTLNYGLTVDKLKLAIATWNRKCKERNPLDNYLFKCVISISNKKLNQEIKPLLLLPACFHLIQLLGL